MLPSLYIVISLISLFVLMYVVDFRTSPSKDFFSQMPSHLLKQPLEKLRFCVPICACGALDSSCATFLFLGFVQGICGSNPQKDGNRQTGQPACNYMVHHCIFVSLCLTIEGWAHAETGSSVGARDFDPFVQPIHSYRMLLQPFRHVILHRIKKELLHGPCLVLIPFSYLPIPYYQRKFRSQTSDNMDR